jgi:hypothetical protein
VGFGEPLELAGELGLVADLALIELGRGLVEGLLRAGVLGLGECELGGRREGFFGLAMISLSRP